MNNLFAQVKADPLTCNVVIIWLTYWCPCQGKRGGIRPGCLAWGCWSAGQWKRVGGDQWRGRAWCRGRWEGTLLQGLADFSMSFGKTSEQDISHTGLFSLVNIPNWIFLKGVAKSQWWNWFLGWYLEWNIIISSRATFKKCRLVIAPSTPELWVF